MEADLWEANLMEANLREADLGKAKIKFIFFPSIRFISSISFRDLSDDLQLELMRRDALAHPHPERFDIWAKNGDCPYKNEERFWLFEPKQSLWRPGLPQMTDRDLIVALCKSQGWEIREY